MPRGKTIGAGTLRDALRNPPKGNTKGGNPPLGGRKRNIWAVGTQKIEKTLPKDQSPRKVTPK